MYRRSFLASLLVATACLSCSGTDSSSSSGGSGDDPLITGKWVMGYETSSGTKSEKLDATFVLAGKQGTFSGTGDIIYVRNPGGGPTTYTIQNTASGSFSESELRVVVTTAVGAQSFEFLGTRDDLGSTTRYKGQVTLILSGETISSTGQILYKSTQ